jgi:hypothetical protein
MSDVVIGRLDPISSQTHDVTVTLTDLSFVQTSRGRRYAYPDFGSDFIEALHKALVGPRRRGLFRSTPVCAWCEASLDGVVRHSVTVATDVVLTKVPPIHVDLDMPGLTCSRCGRPMVMIDDRAVASDLSGALIAAFNSAGLAPG